MTIPRSQQIDLDVTPYYHCTSRCVRRAFLCGKDALTGFDFDHRRQWIEDHLHKLAGVFAIDLCGYAVMSNHYHVVLHVDIERSKRWSNEEVVDRWSQLYRLPDWFVVLAEQIPGDTRVVETIATWRERLSQISWFMGNINQLLARRANREDKCTGRFWEGRFTCQALLDEEALLQCLVYVDLNPIRAAKARKPETSCHTSIKARIEGRERSLAPMTGANAGGERFTLPVSKPDYLALVDWSGRQWCAGKRGRIDPRLPSIFQRMETRPSSWLDNVRHLMKRYCRAIGSRSSLLKYRAHLGQQRLKGVTG